VPAERPPSLPPTAVAELLPFAADHSEATAPTHETPLVAAIAATRAGSEWLEAGDAGVLAGYLPSFEGISLALRATHLDWLGEVEKARAVGAVALGWTELANSYCELTVLLDGFVIDMERRRSEILSAAPPASVEDPHARERLAAYDALEANDAEWRALRADDRRRSAELDTQRARSAQRAWSRLGDRQRAS
jgi:hypothetical protein